MFNSLRKLLRPTLRQQLEDGVREALRRYADRRIAPDLRVYVSTDLVPEGMSAGMFARAESLAPLWTTMWPGPASRGTLSYDIDFLTLRGDQDIAASLGAASSGTDIAVATPTTVTGAMSFSITTPGATKTVTTASVGAGDTLRLVLESATKRAAMACSASNLP